jgi:hypothetical protein
MAGLKNVVRIVLPAAAIIVVAAGAFVLREQLARDDSAAERRALLARQTELTARALMPGSRLACLDGGAGETMANACEKAVFADAATAAAAVALTAARVDLLQSAKALADKGDRDVLSHFASARRAIELDRFGLAAQVLADRDGCTPDRCAGFALVNETGALKANMKARVFEQYVSRHAAAWEQSVPVANAAPMASVPPAEVNTPLASAEPAAAAPTGKPVDPKWDFPSAASIPPVSIMNSEPARPKTDEAAAAKAEANADTVPTPPKRPQAAAPTPAEPR